MAKNKEQDQITSSYDSEQPELAVMLSRVPHVPLPILTPVTQHCCLYTCGDRYTHKICCSFATKGFNIFLECLTFHLLTTIKFGKIEPVMSQKR